MIDLDVLAKVDMCDGMDIDQLAAVRDCCRVEEWREGDSIFTEGQDAEAMCFVLRGRVDLRYELPHRETSRDHTLVTVPPHSAFGWSALVEPNRYTLSSYCAKDGCKVLRLDREELLALFERHPAIGYLFMRNLTRVMGRRFHALQELVAREDGLNAMSTW